MKAPSEFNYPPDGVGPGIFVYGDDWVIANHPMQIMSHQDAMRVIEKINAFYSSVSSDDLEAINDKLERDFYNDMSDDDQSPPKPRKPKRGVVYLMASGAYHKIRLTTQSVEQRLAEIQKTMPHFIEVVHTIKSDDIETLEAELHERYEGKRVTGEWFALSPEDVFYIKSLGGA